MGKDTTSEYGLDLAQALDGDASVVRPLISLVGLMLVLLCGVIFFGAHRADLSAETREAQQVSSYVQKMRDDLVIAMDHVAQRRTQAMVEAEREQPELFTYHVHRPLAMQAQIDQSLLIGPDGQVINSASEAEDQGVAARDTILADLETWISASSAAGGAVSDFIALDGNIHVASIVEFSCDATRPCHLVTISCFTDNMQPRLQTGWGLEQFRAQTVETTASGMSSHPLVNNSGDQVGWFVWRASRPGQALLVEYMPWLATIMVGVLIVAALVWRRAREVTAEVIKRQEEVSHRALHDPLTGLANRTLFNSQLDAALSEFSRHGKGFALHLIDLDRFKDVNDTLGHQAGDELIRQAATRLKSVCRASDTVARLGGDEFAIVQSDVSSPASAARLARRAVEQLANVYKVKGAELFVSGSIGLALCEDDSHTRDELTRQADIALYRAKESGRNQFCFFETEMDASIQEKRRVETDLRAALNGECGHLHVVYQAQVSADGRNVRGMEALVRWSHPERGMMSPAVFVPVAEETGLIRQLGEFVMRESLRTAHEWPEITMAINVSAAELHARDYAERVTAMAAAEGVRTDQIELEITETVLLEDSARVTRTIKQLKAAGFRIALDDFGTGYSSLSYLRRHQVDKLKIDQSFVSSIGVRDDANAVVQAIIHLGEALGLTVTAEGVETETQREALRSQGCAYLQGYLFSRPLQRDQIGDLVELFRERGAA